MFHFLGFIFFFILIILLIGFVILWKIINTFLGIGRHMNGNANHTQEKRHTTTDSQSMNNSTKGPYAKTSSSNDRKKIFDDDEGEYVEFEEIKD